MRLFLALGRPGDIVAGAKAPTYTGYGETSITFSKQAMKLPLSHGVDSYLVSKEQQA